jgi:hypothetical protein
VTSLKKKQNRDCLLYFISQQKKKEMKWK